VTTMTAPKRSALSQLRRTAYFTQRGIGDAQAVVRGPGAYGRRRARRSITRSVFRLFNEALRAPYRHERPCPGVKGWGRSTWGG